MLFKQRAISSETERKLHVLSTGVTREHSRNKIIMQPGLFENQIRPGVLQSTVQQTRVLHEYQKHKPHATDYVSMLSLRYEILANCVFVERWTGALQVQSRFRNLW